MKLRQGFLLIVLVLLGGTLCRGQTTFVTGNLTAMGAVCTTAPSTTNHVTISTIGFGGATFTVSGTWTGTVSFYASGDGGLTWQPLNVTPSNSTTPVTTTTTGGLWQANVSAYTHVCSLASAFSSGTIAVRIHCSSISARAGGGGGTSGGGGAITPPAGSLTGQTLTVAGGSVIGTSPGILDSPSSPIATTTFTPACGTTNIGDRAHIMVLSAAVTVTIPLSTGTNCSNSIFYFLAQNTEIFQPSGAEIFDVYDGSRNYTACASGCTQTSLQIPIGSYVTIDNGSGTTWHCLVESGAPPVMPTTLDSIISAASSPAPLLNANYNIPWDWSLTAPGAGLSLGESGTASTGGTTTGNINNQSILQLQTAVNSTATPLMVTQGALTGTTAIPAMQVSTTWNNGALVGQGLVIQAACTACAAGSNALNIVNASGASAFSVTNGGVITSGGSFTNLAGNGIVTTSRVSTPLVNATASGAPTVVQGGIDSSSTAALGNGIFRGADNNSAGATATAGAVLLRGGMLNGSAAATAIEGTVEVAAGYFGTGIAAAGDVVCATAVQFQVTDCPLGAANIVGISNNNVGIQNAVVSYGTVPVKLTAAGTIGHTICLSTVTVGQATDSGGTAACTTAGAQIGVIVATAGTVTVGNATTTATVTLSTTLPLVQLHIR